MRQKNLRTGRVFLLLLTVCLLSVSVFTFPTPYRDAAILRLSNVSSSVADGDVAQVGFSVTNYGAIPLNARVIWYLSYVGDTQPWIDGVFASTWQTSLIKPGASSKFSQKAVAAIPPGVYQLTVIVHEVSHHANFQVDQSLGSKLLTVTNSNGFFRESSPGPTSISHIELTASHPSTSSGGLMGFTTHLSLHRVATSAPVSIHWDLIDASTVPLNLWASASPLISGNSYALTKGATSFTFSPSVLGRPGQKYALRVEVIVNHVVTDDVVDTSSFLTGPALSATISRNYFPPATDPLVITSASVPSTWLGSADPHVSVTVTNASGESATGQMILQVGKPGDAAPWEDPSYSFPVVTFTAPPHSSVVVHIPGAPQMLPGKYELGIYVHNKVNNQFVPGDEVFSSTSISEIG